MKRILTNLILASIVILTSCSKEDDLLTPIPNNNNTQTTNTNVDTTTVDTTNVNNTDTTNFNNQDTTHEIYGSEYDVTYYSYSLLVDKARLWSVGCPPSIEDTLITYETYGGEAYLTDNGSGYLTIPIFIKDFEDYAFLDTHNPSNFVNSVSTISINNEPISGENNQITLGLYYYTAAVGGHQSERRNYVATFNIIDKTGNTLILEHNTGPEGRGFLKDVRIELQKR